MKNVHVFVPVFLYAVTMSFFRLKELFQVKNGVTTSLGFFFFKMPKIWVGRTTVNREKEDDQMYRDQSGEFLCQWSEVL